MKESLSRKYVYFEAVPQLRINLGLVPMWVVHQLRIWQLVTYMFIHVSVFHIVFNMLALWMFGAELERIGCGQLAGELVVGAEGQRSDGQRLARLQLSLLHLVALDQRAIERPVVADKEHAVLFE